MLNAIRGFFHRRLDPKPDAGGALLVGLFGGEADKVAVRLAESLTRRSGEHSSPPRFVRFVTPARDCCLPTTSQSGLEESERKRLRLGRGALRVECARNPAARFLEIANESGASQLVLAIPFDADDAEQSLARHISRDRTHDVLMARVPAGFEFGERTLEQVIVPFASGSLSDFMLRTAARLAGASGKVTLHGLLEIPRSLPTDAPSLPEESTMHQELDRSSELLTGLGISTATQVLKTRGLGKALDKVARAAENQVLLLNSEMMAENISLPGNSSPSIRCLMVLCQSAVE